MYLGYHYIIKYIALDIWIEIVKRIGRENTLFFKHLSVYFQ